MRILKIGDEGRRQYTYDQLSVITEANESNVTVSKYDYGLDQLVSLENTSEGRSFFHLDFLGSTANLTDGVGGTRQSILYDAWGNERDRVGSSANKFTFTGHEKDEETGLIYARARFYDPDIGRFLSQDSFLGDVSNAPSLHRYFYANQNPLLFFDPTGRFSQSLAEIARKEKERRAENGADAQAFSDKGTAPVAARPQSTSTTTFAETQAAVDQSRKGSTNEFDFRNPNDPSEIERRAALERAVAAVRSGAPGATIIEEQVDLEIQLVDAYDDTQLTGVVFAKRKLRRRFRSASGAAMFAGEIYIVVAGGTANDIKIMATGKDLTGREANKWIAAGAIIIVGVTSSQFSALNRVDDELRGATQGKRGTSGSSAASGGRGASRADTPPPGGGGRPPGGGGRPPGGDGGSGGGFGRGPRQFRSPLTKAEKAGLRKDATDIWQQATGRRAIWDNRQVHHRIPLEWSHLFKANPNRTANLIAMESRSHSQLTTAWNAWRRSLNGRTPNATEVLQRALRLDQQFAPHMKFVR